MRDMILITNVSLSRNNLTPILINEFKKLNVLDDDEDHLYLKTKSTGLEIYYTPEDRVSDEDYASVSQKIIEKLPNKEAYTTSISCTSAAMAKRIVDVISKNFPGTYVDDDDYDWFGTAEEFLASKHQEIADAEFKKNRK